MSQPRPSPQKIGLAHPNYRRLLTEAAQSMRQSSALTAPVSVVNSLVHTCSMENGSAGNGAAATRETSYAPRTTCWNKWAWPALPSVLGVN
jgi:hypothetical protein